MSRFTLRDLVVIAAFVGGAAVVSVLALIGYDAWALSALSLLIAAIGVVSRVEFVSRRKDFQLQRAEMRSLRSSRDLVNDLRNLRRLLEKSDRERTAGINDIQENLNKGFRSARHNGHSISDMKDVLSADMLALRSELRGMRVAQQLISQTTAATKAELHSSLSATAVVADDLQGLHQLFGRYMPVAPLPSLLDSPLGAPGAFLATSLIEQHKPTCVWHRGSLASALWMAYAIRRLGQGTIIFDTQGTEDASHASMMVAAHGLSEWVEVRESASALGASYDDEDAEQLDDDRIRLDLLVLDQSTAVSGADRQYPTASELSQILADDGIVIVSDADRSDVQHFLAEWTRAEHRLVRLPSPHVGIEIYSRRPAPVDAVS